VGYLVATGGLDGFVHLEHFELDNFMFGVAFAVVSEGASSVSSELIPDRASVLT
jgi:hypothetical protein